MATKRKSAVSESSLKERRGASDVFHTRQLDVGSVVPLRTVSLGQAKTAARRAGILDSKGRLADKYK